MLKTSTQRRLLLRGLVVAPLAGLAAPNALAAVRERRLAFYHTHTDERLQVTYLADGRLIPESLAQVNYLLRDFRNDEVHPIDPDLLDTLHQVCGLCGGGTFEIISGYRSPETNQLLRKRSRGVARASFHLQGRAIDIRLSGFDTARLRDAALTLQRGGVGYYASSDFVHLDTGRVRTW